MSVVLFVIAGCTPLEETPVFKKAPLLKGYTLDSARAFLVSSNAACGQSWHDIGSFRNQLMVLSLTVSVTIFGFAYRKGKVAPELLVVVMSFCLLMYSMDTQLLSMQLRLQWWSTQCTNDYWKLSSWTGCKSDTTNLVSAMAHVDQGIEHMPLGEKASLFFSTRLVEQGMYGGPGILAFLFMVLDVSRRWMKEPRESDPPKDKLKPNKPAQSSGGT